MKIVAKVKTNTTKIILYHRKQYEYIIQPMSNVLDTCANAGGKQ
jgi:hypothetical protein